MNDARATPFHMIRTGPRGGAPVLLVHPTGLDLTCWDHQIAALAGCHDVVAIDLPGHGRTPGSPDDWALDALTDRLSALIRALDAGPVDFVGLSVGGILGQALTLARSDLVRSLTLIDTAASFPEIGRTAMRERAAASRAQGMASVIESTIARWFTPDTQCLRPDLVERAVRTLLADDPMVHAAVWDMIRDVDFVPHLGRIDCPTLILVGERDPSSPPSAAMVLHQGIKASELHVIAEASHMAPLEQPQMVNALLAAFLARVTERAAGSSSQCPQS